MTNYTLYLDSAGKYWENTYEDNTKEENCFLFWVKIIIQKIRINFLFMINYNSKFEFQTRVINPKKIYFSFIPLMVKAESCSYQSKGLNNE